MKLKINFTIWIMSFVVLIHKFSTIVIMIPRLSFGGIECKEFSEKILQISGHYQHLTCLLESS